MKNKALAIRAIKSDCKIAGDYMDDAGNTCAIGMLALKAGVGKWTVKGASGSIDTTIPSNHVGFKGVIAMRNAIKCKFGLTIKQQREIQAHNDIYEKVGERRKAILAYLKDL